MHPLEPLSAEDIAATAAIVVRDHGPADALRFVSIELHEPAKRGVLDGETDLPREAFVVVRDANRRCTVEAVVSLTEDTVRSWTEVPGVQPAFTRDELDACGELLESSEAFREAMRQRGVTDMSLVVSDLWAVGNGGGEQNPEAGRLVRALPFVKDGMYDNHYAHPVEGLLVLIDLDRRQVVEVADHGVVPVPEQQGNYIPDLMVGLVDGYTKVYDHPREDLRPIEISQPEGPSFTVDGHQVDWQRWQFRIGYTPREGLVLHQVGYHDGGRLRPILYRASLSELYVPYGDPNPTHHIKNVFDEGEWGIAHLLNYLQLDCDCLGHIRYFDVVVNNWEGEPLTLPNAICMHEEDYGVGWKHTDGGLGHVETRRQRRLVLSSFYTANNYEYGFFWYFYLDGTIEFEVKLTGIVSTGAFDPAGEPPECGTVLASGLYGPNHQHFFNVRLDMCVDGERNSVYEVDSAALPAGPANPAANAWAARPTLLAKESQAQRVVEPRVGRYWTVANPSAHNGLGRPVAYKLAPGENILPFAQEGSQTHRRAGFAYRHLWVTAYDPRERYAAGDYPNQRPDDDGLPAYVRADRPLEDTDVVLWYTFGAHHVTRPEDWPVMPVSCIGFHLKPVGFFDRNPALDLPRPTPRH
jgi:primary-amine oxidase